MAIFNSGFPATYQQMYPQYQQPFQQGMQMQNVQQPQAQQSSIIWVSGEVGAKSYPVAPNTTVQLWDSESKVIYLKSADASGMPSLKILDYTIRDQSNGSNPLNAQSGSAIEYVTKAEFDDLKAKFADFLQNRHAKSKKEVIEDE